MRRLLTILAVGMLAFTTRPAAAQSVAVQRFHKVIISPYIQATFVEGDQESVTINNCNVDSSKLHIEVNYGTLRVYLEGAKDIPNNDMHKHLYPNHAVIATITYRKLDDLSLRGEETYLCQSPLSAKTFTLHVYGDPKVLFTEVHFARMHTTMYGDGSLDIRSGNIDNQYYTSYGDGHINSTAISGQAAKVTAFGEAEFKVNVSDWIKITSFGEAHVRYLGNPEIVKGINIGRADVQRMD